MIVPNFYKEEHAKIINICNKYIPIFESKINIFTTKILKDFKVVDVKEEIKYKKIIIEPEYMYYCANTKVKSASYENLDMIQPLMFSPISILSANIVLTLSCEKGTQNIYGRITCLPNCCGIAVISDIHNNISTNEGLGTLFFNMLEEICVVNNYTYILATDKSSGYGNNIISKSAKRVACFKNRRSNNNVNIYLKNIRSEEDNIIDIEEYTVPDE